MACASEDGSLPSSYEQLRDARLAENRRRMQELGLLSLSDGLASAARRKLKLTPAAARPRAASLRLSSSPPRRRSSRLSLTPLPSYKEIDEPSGRRGSRDVDILQGSKPEYYTMEHEKLLGECKEDWELFRDGYDTNGNRVYDPACGKTCHQCRQKTLGMRTWCSKCESLRGQFCGDCLFMRYGENLHEVSQNQKWICPPCREICNCSVCRIRKGWAPTGSLYRTVVALGFKSVAHYLILTKRQPLEEVNDDSKASCISTATDLAEGEASVMSQVSFGIKTATDITGDLKLFGSLMTVDDGSESIKEIMVHDISDTECELHTPTDQCESIATRLRKRPRRA